MLTYPWHRAEIMRNTPDFTPKSAQNAYKQKITVADIVSTTVTDLEGVDTLDATFDSSALPRQKIRIRNPDSVRLW